MIKVNNIRTTYEKFTNKLNKFLLGDSPYNYLSVSFLCLAVAQIVFIIYINIFANQHYLGYDASWFYLKAIEIWNQKTLFPLNVVEQTSLILDSSISLAAILYGITGNIFLGFGIANIIISALFLSVLFDICMKLNVEKLSAYIALCFLMTNFVTNNFFTPNPLTYFTSLFVSGGFYSICFLTIAMVFRSLLVLSCKKLSLFNIIFCAITLCLMLLSGISRGYYMLPIVLAPAIIFLCLKAVFKNDIKHIVGLPMLYILLCILAIIIGKYIQINIVGYVSKENEMVLVTVQKFFSNLKTIYTSSLYMMGYTVAGDVHALSKIGISYLINLVLHIIYIFTLICSLIMSVRMLKKDSIYIAHKGEENVVLLTLCFLLVYLITFSSINMWPEGDAVDKFERYIPPIYFMSIPLICFFIDRLNKDGLLKKAFIFTLFIILALSNVFGAIFYSRAKTNDARIAEVIQESYDDVKVVYGIGESYVSVRNLRVIDTSRYYKVLNSFNTPHHWGDYTYYNDISMYEGPVILLTTENEYHRLPDYIKNRLEFKETVNSFSLYYAPKNIFDLSNNFPENGEKHINLPYTFNVETSEEGYIKDDGTFYSNGVYGYVLWGPYIAVEPGLYDLRLNYEVISEHQSELIIGVFDISGWNGKEVLAKTDMLYDSTTAVINDIVINDTIHALEHRVWIDEGVCIKIISIDIISK